MSKQTISLLRDKVARIFATRPWLLMIVVALAYALLTAYYYLGNAVLSCGDTLPTGIGDATAGLIWLHSVDNNDPWWGFTYASNYPFGEKIGLPFHILAQTIYIPFWAISKLAGPVCGYNLLTGFGFVFSAMVMFLFINWLTKRSLIAFIAGFAVAFTPYLQYKTGLHPSYVFQGLFVLAIWIFLAFWRRPNWKLAVGLGVVASLFFYTDPYFVLLGGILSFGLIVTGIIGSLIGGKKLAFVGRHLFLLLLSVAVLAVAISPILYVQQKYKDRINTLVSSSRSDIHTEAEIYGARPSEYFLPNANQPLLGAMFGHDYYGRNQHGSNTGETQLSLSLTLIVIASITSVVIIKKKVRHEKFTKEWRMQQLSVPFIAFVVAGAGLLAFLFSLPPTIYGIPTPVSLLIELTETWRVMARLQIIVNICLVILAAVGLAVYFSKKRGGYLKPAALAILVFILVAFEYQSFFPFRETWSYRTASPAYHWLKQQGNIKTAAEYPLDEPARTIYPTYYFSYQVLHGKNLINATLPASPQSNLRNALRDLDDPQTVPILRSLGVEVVLVHTKDNPGAIEGLEEVKEIQRENSRFKTNEYVWAYRVLPGPKPTYLLAPDRGFNELHIKGITEVGYQTSSDAKMLFIPIPGQSDTPVAGTVSMDIRSATNSTKRIIFSQGDRVVWEGDVGSETNISFPAMADKSLPLTIKSPSTGIDDVAILRHINFEPGQ